MPSLGQGRPGRGGCNLFWRSLVKSIAPLWPSPSLFCPGTRVGHHQTGDWHIDRCILAPLPPSIGSPEGLCTRCLWCHLVWLTRRSTPTPLWFFESSPGYASCIHCLKWYACSWVCPPSLKGRRRKTSAFTYASGGVASLTWTRYTCVASGMSGVGGCWKALILLCLIWNIISQWSVLYLQNI